MVSLLIRPYLFGATLKDQELSDDDWLVDFTQQALQGFPALPAFFNTKTRNLSKSSITMKEQSCHTYSQQQVHLGTN